jgi:hypothetical protein
MSAFYLTKRYFYVINYKPRSFFFVWGIFQKHFQNNCHNNHINHNNHTYCWIVDDTNAFCYIILMHGRQNMLKRLRNQMDCRSQQDSGTINDSQSLLIHSFIDG